MRMRLLIKLAAGLVALYLVLLAGLLAVMRHPTLFGQVMARVPEPVMVALPFRRLWFIAREGRLKAGDIAPDFNLATSDMKSRIQLASWRGRKPVVLVFGSYT